MHTYPTLAAAAVALLSALPTAHAGLYLKSSPVIQIDVKNYEKLVARSNYTTALEFYAPWCGHCQNLKPAYERAAKSLDGVAQVAAVNCDEDENKPLCGQFGVQGFPTIKIVRPGKKAGKPIIEDYNGHRTAKAITDVVKEKIVNHVQRVTDQDIDKFLHTKNESAKAILFTDKGTTSPLLKGVAIDFLDVIQVAQIRNKETKAVAMFGIESFPALVLLPGGEQPGLLYDGEMKKEGMVNFLSQAGTPNPKTASEKLEAKKGKKASKESESKKSTAKEESTSTSSSEPQVTKAAEVAPPIPAITEAVKLTKECLNPKTGTCILALVPAAHGETAEKALSSLSEIAFKHAHGHRHLFPFYEIHTEIDGASALTKSLDLSGEVELIAVNGKRGWWRHFEGSDFGIESVESWIDAIRLSEGVKNKLPKGVIAEGAEEKVEVKVEEDVKIEVPTESDSASYQGAEPTPEATEATEEPVETPADHKRDEL